MTRARVAFAVFIQSTLALSLAGCYGPPDSSEVDVSDREETWQYIQRGHPYELVQDVFLAWEGLHPPGTRLTLDADKLPTLEEWRAAPERSPNITGVVSQGTLIRPTQVIMIRPGWIGRLDLYGTLPDGQRVYLGALCQVGTPAPSFDSRYVKVKE